MPCTLSMACDHHWGIDVELCGRRQLMAALIVLIPFFTAGNSSDLDWAYYTSLGLALLTLFGLGLFLGRISKGSMIVYGLKTVFAGVVSIAFSFFLGVEG
ncbi:MAG: hypothetical protein WBD62_06990 [Anaerolineales bacterium]